MGGLRVLEANRPLAELVIPKAELDAALISKQNPQAGSMAIDDVISASRLGASLFDDIKLVVSAAAYAKQIEAELDTLMREPITADHHKHILEKLSGIAEENAASGFLEVRRRCTMGYCSAELNLVITDPGREAMLRYHARLKSQCLGHEDGLPFLPYESHVFPKPTGTCNVDSSVLASIKKSRQLMAEVMKNDALTSFSAVQAAVTQAAETFTSIDASAVLELEYVATGLHEHLAVALEQQTLRCLPDDKTQDPDVSRVTRELDRIMGSKLFSLATHESQARVGSVRDIVHGLGLNKPPPQHLSSSSGFWAQVHRRLPYFVREQTASSAGSQEPAVRHGSAALKIRLAAIEEKIKRDPKAIELHQLERFHPWAFLMSEAEVRRLSELIKIVMKAKSSKRQTPSTSAGAKREKPAKSKKSKQQSASVNQFFGSDSGGEDLSD